VSPLLFDRLRLRLVDLLLLVHDLVGLFDGAFEFGEGVEEVL
jgi:hypothetical protein